MLGLTLAVVLASSPGSAGEDVLYAPVADSPEAEPEGVEQPPSEQPSGEPTSEQTANERLSGEQPSGEQPSSEQLGAVEDGVSEAGTGAPVPALAPVSAGVVAPDPAPSLPVLPPMELPPPPPPPDGAGRLVGGSVAIALGLGAVSVVGYEASREDGNPGVVAGTFIPLGLAGLGVGVYLLIRGAKARARLLEWRSYAEQRGRPSGSGMVVGGTMSVAISGVTLVAAAVQSRDVDTRGRPLNTALWTVGGAGLATGAALLSTGLVRRKRYQAWRQRTFLAAPVVTRLPGGFGLGVAGRF
ncbi:hypothetical protein G6O69_04365 [Pseudenhygromyxa sp. WMMC2535]|uniref:hypothetical protein n=1 Tax=Pseudenhygromyxa sp. WMMC2535 TaxID=2712867 RepID=UPI001557CC5C|nr:hypothetical protein [Pseudenhygromyxa sp. WMMC2535]NVB37052.1 hypothetical protein [Pseudenhygromyxa sp. WMMC2535]